MPDLWQLQCADKGFHSTSNLKLIKDLDLEKIFQLFYFKNQMEQWNCAIIISGFFELWKTSLHAI